MEETQYLDTAEDNGQDRQIAGWILLCAPQSGGPVVRMQSEGSLSSAEHQTLCGRLGNGRIDRAGNRLCRTARATQQQPGAPAAGKSGTSWCWVVSIADPAPNAFVLDKLIAIAEYQKIEPVIVITKCDLADPKNLPIFTAKQALPLCMKRGRWSIRVQAVMEMLKDKTQRLLRKLRCR